MFQLQEAALEDRDKGKCREWRADGFATSMSVCCSLNSHLEVSHCMLFLKNGCTQSPGDLPVTLEVN